MSCVLRFLEQNNENDLAAAAYADLVNEKTDIRALLPYQKEFIDACVFLVKHYATRKDVEQAKHFANQLRRYSERPEVCTFLN